MDFISGTSLKRTTREHQSRSEFTAYINEYLKRMSHFAPAPREELQVTLIARSPDSLVANVLAAQCEPLREAGIAVRAIFARLSPQQAAAEWFHSFPFESGGGGIEYVRLVKNPKLLDAHEQLILGERMCWSGDALRRSQEGRHLISLFEDQCPGSARLGRLAFQALWGAAVEIPRKYIERAIVAGSECAASELPAQPSQNQALHKGQHWISTRH